MTSWLILVSICAISCVAVGAASWFSTPLRLRRIITINMMMVVSFGTLLGDFGGYVTNYGTAWYATVVGTQIVLLDRYGRLAAAETIPACYMAVTLALLCTFPLTFAPVLPGNDAGAAVIVLAQHRPQVLIAAYAALGPAIAVVDLVYAKLRPRSRWLAVVAAAVMSQVVDSVIFFPLAFGDLGTDFVVTAAVSGLIVKIPMTLAIAAAGLMAARVALHVTQLRDSTAPPTSASTGR